MSKFLRSFLLLMGIFLLSCPPSLIAAEKSNTTFLQFHIQQEISYFKGVWVSRPRDLDKKLLELINNNKIRSWDDYAYWLQKNIKYRKDELKDAWASPQVTLNLKQGDCEDFTFLNIEVAKILGYQPRFLAFVNHKKTHAVCVFKNQDHYVWFDNARLKKTKAASLSEFASEVTKEYPYHYLLELDLKSHQWKLLYTKS